MPKRTKVTNGHYEYKGFHIIKDTSRSGNPWDVIRDYQKISEEHVGERMTLKECIEWLDESPPEPKPPEEPKLKSGRGKPVFVVTDDFLEQLSQADDEDFKEAQDLFKEAVKDEQNRVRIIFLALIRRKIDKIEKMDMFTTKVENIVNKDLKNYSIDQLMEFYEIISRRMEQESSEIARIVNSL